MKKKTFFLLGTAGTSERERQCLVARVVSESQRSFRLILPAFEACYIIKALTAC